MKKFHIILFTLLLVAIATLCKFFFGPELNWSGFTPVFAIALFSGFIVKDKSYSFILPLVALLISDVVIQVLYLQGMFPYAGIYGGQWFQYLLLMGVVLIGWKLKGNKAGNYFAAGVIAPTLFFLISNFAVWMSPAQTLYSKDFSGLMTCYVAGLPFYKNAILSTLIFLPGITLVYNYIKRSQAAVTMA